MIAAIVLAAGNARRYGGGKLLVPLAGQPLIRRTAERILASEVDQVIVVHASADLAVRDALRDLPVLPVGAPDPDAGLATSIVTGVSALPEGTRAALIVLGDQPAVRPDVVRRLVDAWRATGKPIAVPVYHGVRGNPVLFDTVLIPELLALTGDRGAHEVIAADASRVTPVAFASPPPADLDRPQDLDAVRREWERTA